MERNDAVSVFSMASIRAALLILFSCGLAQAESVYKFKKRVTPHLLQEELLAAGFNVSPALGIACSSDDCVIHWGPGGEAKNPQAVIDSHVYVDPKAVKSARAAERAFLRSLLDKWRQGIITPLEKDDLLKRFLMFVLERI